MLCERGCLPAAWLAKGGLRLRSSLTYLTRPRSIFLTLTLSLSLSYYLSVPLSISTSLCASSSRPIVFVSLLRCRSIHLPSSIFLPLPFCSPRHAGRSFALATTFPPTEPPTPRLYNDVNSHAHVFKSPHYSCDLRPDSWNRTRFLTSKATVAFSSRGVRLPNFPCVLQQ